MLTFTAEQKALDAQERIWINVVRAKASQGNGLVGLANDPYTTAQVAALTDNQVKVLVIYGFKKDGLKMLTEGFSTTCVTYKKAYEQDLWYMHKVDEQFMTEVIFDGEEPFDPDWLDPSEI